MSVKSVLFENLLEKYGYDAAVLIPSPNMNWLTGQTKILMERPTALIFRPGKRLH